MASSAAGSRSERETPARAAVRWMGVAEAAHRLGIPVVTLRRTLERNLRRHADGAVEVRLDGLRGRKFGRLWRVWLADCWTEPETASASARRT